MSDNRLGEVGRLAAALVAANIRVGELEDALKAAKETQRRLREESLPDAMTELGLTKIQLESGEKIAVGLEVYCSIPTARKDEAFEWLEDNGFGGLIKTEVSVPFGKGDLSKAAKLAAQLAKKFDAVQLDRSVHPQTLKAFIKERLANGTDVPLDVFGARPINTAKVS